MLSSKGLRITRQRQIILEEIKKVTSHPTADEVFHLVRKRLPRISLGTVYRNLEILAESGIIQQLLMCGSQKRFDGNPETHSHVRCVHCGRVADLSIDMPELQIGNLVEGFDIVGYRLEFLGVCPACKSARRPGTVQA
jgi:Fur family ferric uptake transcriptional regulator